MKSYKKTHTLAEAAEGHIENIFKRGGTYEMKRINGKFEVNYSFPDKKNKPKALKKKKTKTKKR